MRLSLLIGWCGVATFAQGPAAQPFSVPPNDAPELAAVGKFAVGVRTLDLVHRGQPDVLNYSAEKGIPTYDRPLKIELWYPATLAAGQKAGTVYESAMVGRAPAPGSPATFKIAGLATRDAAPVAGQKFPLVIVSHGYPGSRTFMTYLGENIASKGYVVAAIDHTDSVFGEVRGFPSTLLNRSADQLFTIEELSARGKRAGDVLSGLVDETRVAIIGYSMGGYGALASSGAPYSKKSAAATMVPGKAMEPWTAGHPQFGAHRPAGLKAVVAIAPWGAQPPVNSWDAEGMAGIKIPSLFIVGDQDDVSGYEQGVKRAYDWAVNSERCLLVYENARHNTGGNPPPPDVALPFAARQSFEEPVWRKDRITAINQHFVTAFLDLHLKGDQSRRAYLRVPVKRSSEAVWPGGPGEARGPEFGTGEGASEKYWKGFQKRWALGLQMSCVDPAR